MNTWMRGLAAVVMGLIVAFVVTFGIEWINSLLSPLPAGLDRHDEAALKAAIAQLPVQALLGVLVGWFLAAVAGTFMATRIARGDHRPAWFLGVLLVAGAIATMRAIPHPVWFWVAALVAYPIAIWLGARSGEGTGDR